MKTAVFLILLYNCINIFYCPANDPEDTILYLYADKLPKFNYDGGLSKYIYSNVKWPKQADVEGYVLVSFVINKQGRVENVKIEKGLTQFFDEEVIKVFENMPLWEPGEKCSKLINVRMYFPVEFLIKN
jgi:TonB family protein